MIHIRLLADERLLADDEPANLDDLGRLIASHMDDGDRHADLYFEPGASRETLVRIQTILRGSHVRRIDFRSGSQTVKGVQ